jgi:hypothetical protein
LHDEIESTAPYFITQDPSKNNRIIRGLLDPLGEWYFKGLFGMATVKDTAELHADVNELLNYDKELKSAVQEDHRGFVAITANLTAFGRNLKSSLETDFMAIESDMKKLAAATNKDVLTLTEITKISTRNSYSLLLMEKISTAASECR